ncbi:MAG: phosphoribosyltransferase [Burkholderiales bacterium]|nr:phosphoribosyltransferase [Burkholderiales bacterium]
MSRSRDAPVPRRPPAPIAPPLPRLPFADRAAAGEALAAHLLTLPVAREAPLVLALPRGGVPVALVVARALHAPLDLLLVRKIGAPGQPELAVAALVDGTPPEVVVDTAMCERVGADDEYLAAKARAALEEIRRRRDLYLGGRAPVTVSGRSVIVVDDGVATGTTMRAALQGLRRQHPRRLVVAVPVASREAAARLRALADEWVCLAEPVPFEAVGSHYRQFEQVGDDDVMQALAAAAAALDEAATP